MVKVGKAPYNVKNTFVEVQVPGDDDATPSRRARSDVMGDARQSSRGAGASSPLVGASRPSGGERLKSVSEGEHPEKADGASQALALGNDEPAYVVPMTPSPFLHSSFPPCVVPPFGFGFGMEGLPPAFDESNGGFGMMEGVDMEGNYMQGMAFFPPEMYHASFGQFGMPYDMPQGAMEGGDFPGEGLGPACNPEAEDFPESAVEGVDVPEGAGPCQEAPPSSLVENCGSEGREAERPRESRRGKGRGREQREEKADARWGEPGDGEQQQQNQIREKEHRDPGNTTVMLRNIPNKYTREMLIKQLNQDYRGFFDFMYLPVDFRNKCNVGYGFINFRTTEACENFIKQFHGVDVRKCLPGLNSKKVAEVTPARVQGLAENVRRLRNSPVMNQLAEHPEWMPLLFNEYGQEEPFPSPDAPLPPVKPRGRNRDGREGRGAAAAT